MKRTGIIIAALIAVPLTAFAAKRNPADYPLPVHVRSTELVYTCNGSFMGSPTPFSCGMRLVAMAIVDGEKLELRSNTSMVLRTGDYKAKLKKEEDSPDQPAPPAPSYEDRRGYELLLPDGKTMTFQVIGESQD